MSAGARMDQEHQLLSMELPAYTDDEDDDSSLGDMLASHADDPGMIAGRNLDWGDAVSGMDDRNQEMITCLCEGVSGRDMADRLHVSPARVCQLKRNIGRHICDAWGEDADEILAQSARSPVWRVAMANAR